MAKKKIGEELISEIKAGLELGMSQETLANELGVCTRTISRALAEAGIQPKKRKEAFTVTPEAIEKMKELRSKGLSNSKIAIELGCHILTVRRHIGCQPKMVLAEYGSIVSHVTGTSFVNQKEESKLKKISTIVKFSGFEFDYEADDSGFLVMNSRSGITAKLDIDRLHTLMSELQELDKWFADNSTTPVYLLDGKSIKSQVKQPLL